MVLSIPTCSRPPLISCARTRIRRSSSLQSVEKGLLSFLDNTRSSLLKKIAEQKELTDELKKEMETAVKEFKERYSAEGGAVIKAVPAKSAEQRKQEAVAD